MGKARAKAGAGVKAPTLPAPPTIPKIPQAMLEQIAKVEQEQEQKLALQRERELLLASASRIEAGLLARLDMPPVKLADLSLEYAKALHAVMDNSDRVEEWLKKEREEQQYVRSGQGQERPNAPNSAPALTPAESGAAPSCPLCDKPMRKIRGTNCDYFWGCTKFPECNGKRWSNLTVPRDVELHLKQRGPPAIASRPTQLTMGGPDFEDPSDPDDVPF